MQENYLIKGMGLFAGIKNKISFFNIFYFKVIDIVVEIVGPASYACKRIKVDNFKQSRLRNGLENQNFSGRKATVGDAKHVDSRPFDRQEIPLKFVVKKQLIEISYIALWPGAHRISIVH